MTVPAHLARLRLAARTLLEWKVPTTARQYQTVLHDLLTAHPHAASWGLRPGSKLFELDENGIILWYLSETLSTGLEDNVSDVNRESLVTNEIRSPKELNRLCFKLLMQYGTGSDSNALAWPGGPQKSTIVERVIETFRDYTRDPQKAAERFILAYHVLIAMLLEEDNPLKREIVEEFWGKVSASPLHNTEIRRLAQNIRKSSIALSAGLLTVVATAGTLGLFKGVESVSRNLSESTALNYLLMLSSVIVSAFATLITVRVSFPRLKNALADALSTLRFRLTPRYFDDVLTLPFHRLLGFVCTTKFKLFLNFLTEPSPEWGNLFHIFLYRTRLMTADAAKSLLSLVGSSEFDALTKTQLLRRLSSIKITRYDLIYRTFIKQSHMASGQYDKRLTRAMRRAQRRQTKR
jgi:hypothetical protein